ncbi:DUF2141 domain-containing protein [Haliscomenobacter sp.]|uniref:DUF2141 domain-containing protein n=1 Tax=Haliscomenobacter sp. TaxID=2717303 RepID=UPI00336512AF
MAFLILILLPLFYENQMGALTVKVTNVQAYQGSIRMAVYNNEKTFPSEKQNFCGAMTSLAPGTLPKLTCENLPFGQYAVAVYHDLNNNGKMDKNAMGIPTEPYGFSNNVQVKWRQPKWADAAFVLSTAKQELTVSLKRWSEY